MPGEPHAKIHEFFPNPLTGFVEYDDEGDAILGWYWQLHDGAGNAISHMMGPYGSGEEAEEACKRAAETEDY